MKKLFVVLPIILLIIIGCGGNEKKDESLKKDNAASGTSESGQVKAQKYKMKSMIITYDMEVMGIKNVMTQYVDEYGAKEANESFGEMDMGKLIGVIKTHTKTIIEDNTTYEIDFEKKTVRKFNFAKSTGSGMDFSAMSQATMDKMKIKKLGTETLLGKTCDVFEIDSKDMRMKGKYYVWNNIAIKTDAEIAGMKTVMTATKIVENPAIPADVFKLPEGFTMEEF